MAKLTKPQLARLAAHLNTPGRDEPSLKDVVKLAELTIESLQSFYKRQDTKLFEEVSAIATFIGVAKRDIAAVGVTDLAGQRIPEAGRELDAIVESTESATNAIMSEAEMLMALEGDDIEVLKQTVQDASMRIFEACTFQDLTGQRVRKVVETLQIIEKRIARLATSLASGDVADTDAEEVAEEHRRALLILNGPQAKGLAIEQDDVDAMFLAGSDQADIDKLFG
jgi:chemotaxis protein CheZ